MKVIFPIKGFEFKLDEFIISEHKSVIDNMNHISNQLKGFYWYLLATIASLGAVYSKILEDSQKIHSNLNSTTFWIVFFVCLAGNVIFWKIADYAIAHGFLFRYLQVKAAKNEKEFYEGNESLERTIRDPSKEVQFLVSNINNKSENYFKTDHLLPDQFVPIYWASIILIIINTLACWTMTKEIGVNNAYFYLSLISIPFIWKLWDFYLTKIKHFISRMCTFRFYLLDKKNQKLYEYFRFPHRFYVVTLMLTGAILVILFHNELCKTEYLWDNLLRFISIYFVILISPGLLFFIFKNFILFRHITESRELQRRHEKFPRVMKLSDFDNKKLENLYKENPFLKNRKNISTFYIYHKTENKLLHFLKHICHLYDLDV